MTADADARPPLGRILTFYSYKGGTGRSMALANLAWVLASGGRRVLAIDWDLEAPGLHRYFRPFLLDEELIASDGVIDIVERYANEAIRPADPSAPAPPDWYLPYADFTDQVLSINYNHFAAGGRLDFLPAGRQSAAYAVKVSSFNWQNLYDRLGGGGFFEALKQRAREEYDYVLIDSRTGVSDTAGICSVQMPDTLVVCFTYNNQSIKGASGIAAWASQRQQQLVQEYQEKAGAASQVSPVRDSPPAYRIFPIPMRVDAGESDRLLRRQAYARDVFRPLTGHLGADFDDYWTSVEVPHNVFYSYEEVLAPFKDNARDPRSVLAAFVRFAGYVTDGDVMDYRLTIAPEERQRLLGQFAIVPHAEPAESLVTIVETEDETLVRLADATIDALSEDERTTAWRLFTRLVRFGREEEGGGLYAIRAPLDDFSPNEQALVATLERKGLLSVASDARQPRKVAFQDPRLLTHWKRLSARLDADREFLVWRQQIRAYLVDWERSGREATQLLSGTLRGEAQLWLNRRRDDLTPAEQNYIALSTDASRAAAYAAAAAAAEGAMPRRASSAATAQSSARVATGSNWWRVAVASLVLPGALLGFFYLRPPGERSAVIVAVAAAATDPLERALLLLDLGPDATVPANAKDLALDLVTTPLPFAVLRQEEHPITTVRFSADMRSLFVGGTDATVTVWPAAGGPPARIVIQTHVGRVVSVAAGPGAKSVFVTGENHIAEVWDVSARATDASKRLPIASTLFSGALVDGQPVVVQPARSAGGKAATLALARFIGDRADAFRTEDFQQLVALPTDTQAVKFSANGTVAAGAGVLEVWLWNLPSGVARSVVPFIGTLRSFAMSPNGAYLAVLTDRALTLWSTTAAAERLTIRADEANARAGRRGLTAADRMAISPDGSVVLLMSPAGNAWLLVGGPEPGEPARGSGLDLYQRPASNLVLGQGAIVDATFSNDGAVFATAGEDGTVRLWENPAGRARPERPSASSSWNDLWKLLRSQTTACLSVSQRTRLLSESESSARTAVNACEAANPLKAFAPLRRAAN